MGLLDQTQEQYYTPWLDNDDLGGYQFVTIKDVINNFMVAYVGEDKIISKIKRTDVAFYAQRAIAEFSFDTLPSDKAIEIEVVANLSFALPQDYVNYVRFSWTDQQGIERIIYPTRNTSNPLGYTQDNAGEYTYDAEGNVTLAQQSTTLTRFNSTTYDPTPDEYGPNYSVDELINLYRYGRRYGLEPETAQANGVFFIDNLKGIVHFSSDMVNRIVTLKYISDGLGTDAEMVVHKFAEDAIYKYIAHAVLATRANTQEYLVQRFKKEMVAAKRNAKLRLSNMKLSEMAQVMRNQSKWIK
mgnify:FL=1|jgi:hypothetical protein